MSNRAVAGTIASYGLPILAALIMVPIPRGGTVWPWRPQMMDLEVYLRAGDLVLAGAGADLYLADGELLPFLYPPVSALLAAPLGLLPLVVVQVAWTAASVLALRAVLARCGLVGVKLTVVSTITVLAFTPVWDTHSWGQVGVFMVALPFLGLVGKDGRAARDRGGLLAGLAAAIKLTPLIYVPFLVAVGRIRAAMVTTAGFLGCTALAAVVLPGPTLSFVDRLAHGDSGLGDSMAFVSNQSLPAAWLRLVGRDAGSLSAVGLLLAAAIAALGIVAGARWYRRGEPAMAVCLVGMAGLAASPVSWTHHYVWLAPLVVLVVLRGHRGWIRWLSFALAVWLIVQPMHHLLPSGGNLEYQWNFGQHLIGSVTLLLTIALLVVALARPPASISAISHLPAHG